MTRRVLLLLAFLLASISLLLDVTGGFVTSVWGTRISARSPNSAALGSGVCVLAWAWLAWRARAVRQDLAAIEARVSNRAATLVALTAGLAAAAAVRFGSYSAAGSDASGYLSYASLLAAGRLVRAESLAMIAGWPDTAATLAPLGWRAVDVATQAPTYAVGLPLLMAPFHLIGGTIAASVLVPLSLGLAVWAAGALAARIAGGAAGIIAAVWLATSPVALIESMQPMSDVPVTAAWLVCWLMIVGDSSRPADREWSRRLPGSAPALIGGAAAAIAVLIRPNLAPLVAVPAMWLVAACARSSLRPALAFAIPVAVAGAIVAGLQWHQFGSPLRSGYGTASELFALSRVAPNVQVYASWLLETDSAVLLAAPLALLVPGVRALRWLLSFAVLLAGVYFLYGVFEVWTYLRFLLPALAIAAIALAAAVSTLLARLGPGAHAVGLAVVVLAVAAINLTAARSLGVFGFADIQSRASLTGHYLAAALPVHSVVIAGEQSGSVRYYADRSIVRWDLADPAGIESGIAALTRAGYDVWIALDVWEEELFRRRFAGLAIGALDWPPRLEAGRRMLTRAWRIGDRPRFMSDGRVVTDRVR